MLNRRELFKLGTGAWLGLTLAPLIEVPILSLGAPATPQEDKKGLEKIEKSLQKVFGKSLKDVKQDPKVKLSAPTIAENGLHVPVSVEVDYPIEDIKSLHIFVDENPDPHISYIELTPLSGKAFFQVPIRMAQSSYVRGIALLKDGSLVGDFKFTKVTVGGCG